MSEIGLKMEENKDKDKMESTEGATNCGVMERKAEVQNEKRSNQNMAIVEGIGQSSLYEFPKMKPSLR